MPYKEHVVSNKHALLIYAELMKDVKTLAHQQDHAFNRMRAVVEGGAAADEHAVQEASEKFGKIWEVSIVCIACFSCLACIPPLEVCCFWQEIHI